MGDTNFNVLVKNANQKKKEAVKNKCHFISSGNRKALKELKGRK